MGYGILTSMRNFFTILVILAFVAADAEAQLRTQEKPGRPLAPKGDDQVVRPETREQLRPSGDRGKKLPPKSVHLSEMPAQSIDMQVENESFSGAVEMPASKVSPAGSDSLSTNKSDIVSLSTDNTDRSADEVQSPETANPYYDFNRYSIILERKPFGDFAALTSKMLTEEEPPKKLPNFAKSYSMCAITDSYGEIMVGFIDKSKKSGSKYYYLRVGETEDGVTLVEADYDNESAKLSRDGQEFWIDMNGPKLSNGASGDSNRPASDPFFSRGKKQVQESYSSRLKRQRAAALKVESRVKYPRENMTKEEITEHLRKLNMELIRAGGSKGPPLPLQLTPEEDAQLVSEGVLAPVDEAATPDVE